MILKLANLPSHHNRASSMLCSWWDTGGCTPFTLSLSHVDRPIWPKVFELWIISIPLLYCPVFVRLGPLEFLKLFCFHRSGFLTDILPYSPASQNLLLTLDVDVFFSRYWFICAVMFGAVSLLPHKLVTHEIVVCCGFWSTSSPFGLVLSRFLMSSNSIILCSSGNFYF